MPRKLPTPCPSAEQVSLWLTRLIVGVPGVPSCYILLSCFPFDSHFRPLIDIRRDLPNNPSFAVQGSPNFINALLVLSCTHLLKEVRNLLPWNIAPAAPTHLA